MSTALVVSIKCLELCHCLRSAETLLHAAELCAFTMYGRHLVWDVHIFLQTFLRAFGGDGMRGRPHSWKNQLRLSAANGGKRNQIPFGWVSIRSFYFVLIFPLACTIHIVIHCKPQNHCQVHGCAAQHGVYYSLPKNAIWIRGISTLAIGSGAVIIMQPLNFPDLGQISHFNFIWNRLYPA